MTKTVKYRPHRGILADAMQEVAELQATVAAIREHEAAFIEACGIDEVRVQVYTRQEDKRNGWPETWLVVGYRNGHAQGVLGFTDGEVTCE